MAPELQAEFGPIPPALIPLDGRPAMAFVLDRAPDGSRAVVAGHEEVASLRRAACRLEGVEVLDVGPTRSLGETVAVAVGHAAPVDGERLVVNLADTVVGDLPPAGDAIAYRVQEDAHRWTTFTRAADGTIASIVDKDYEKDDDAQAVFVGAFAFADAQAFAAALEVALAAPPADLDPFYVAVAAYVAVRGAGALFETGVWHDFGHLDTYHRTRQRFFMDSRAFNELEVDASRGVVRKTSTNAAKLRRETRWYLDLPPRLAHLAPRVLDHGDFGAEAYVDIEFYGYTALADAYLYGAWDGGAWSLALDAVHRVAEALRAEALELPDAEVAAILSAMYCDKTDERLAPVLVDERFAPLRGTGLTVNGVRGLGLDGALARLPELIAAVGLLDPRPLGVLHGDLCLSNILYDRRTGIVRLIDPRGDFGGLPLHGDPLYDRAKLAHSLEGDYDHLCRGLFDLRVDRDGVALDVHLTPAHERVKRLFARRAERALGERDGQRVRLIQALLFLTMIPLHHDRPRSQLAFGARGLALLSEVAACVDAGVPLALAEAA